MKNASITGGQMRALQTLWAMYARRNLLDSGDERAVRLETVGKMVGRSLASFRDLSSREANDAIELLRKSLGLESTRRRRMSERGEARSAGVEGRRGSGRSLTIASADDLAKIEDAISRLGWNQERFSAWLRSPSGPLFGRDVIRTRGDANRVWWALKPMLKRAGLWRSVQGGAA